MMKKLIIGLSLMSSFLYLSCNKQEQTNINGGKDILTNVLISNDVSLNQFQQLLNDTTTTLNKFSPFLNTIKITSLTNINKSNNSITFQVNSLPIYVNQNEIHVNDKNFTLTLENNIYLLSCPDVNFAIAYHIQEEKFILHVGSDEISYEDLTDDQIDNIYEINYYPIFIGILSDLVLEANILNRTPTMVPIKYEGSGIGFHKSRANADYFCKRDYDKILKANPTWCSPGISTSCLWENHICVCTAEFYSGSDC